ncbi:MAG TPA: FAD-dependent oxidoreductase [Micropruina sp.]|nr:FAD-dependent oxidoreductase [Micropruina sp.]
MAYDHDLLVVGGGPGGHRAAIAAAELGRRVAIVDRKQLIGGVCINTGTIAFTTRGRAVPDRYAGRLAAVPFMGEEPGDITALQPIGISGIPEISTYASSRRTP